MYNIGTVKRVRLGRGQVSRLMNCYVYSAKHPDHLLNHNVSIFEKGSFFADRV